MKNDIEYEKFRENIKIIIQEEIETIFIKNNLYRTHSGTVLDVKQPSDNSDPYQQKCGVDLVYTQVKDLLNKTGQPLKINDSVIIFEKIGSNFSNSL